MMHEPADALITSADKTLDVIDFDRLARERLPPAHFGYLATGAYRWVGHCVPSGELEAVQGHVSRAQESSTWLQAG